MATTLTDLRQEGNPAPPIECSRALKEEARLWSKGRWTAVNIGGDYHSSAVNCTRDRIWQAATPRILTVTHEDGPTPIVSPRRGADPTERQRGDQINPRATPLGRSSPG